jgi:hypothetical protein
LALGLGIWLHTRATTQPPLGDAFSYYAKAYYFWADWRGGQGFHPFDIWPFFRPPGTVLMSYPFGFNADPQWFFFRSVFFPAILMLLAAVIVSHRPNAGISYLCGAGRQATARDGPFEAHALPGPAGVATSLAADIRAGESGAVPATGGGDSGEKLLNLRPQPQG